MRKYWGYDDIRKIGTVLGSLHQLVRAVVLNQTSIVEEFSYLFVLFEYALANTRITTWDSGYNYAFWRPIVNNRQYLSLKINANGDNDSCTPLHPSNHISSSSSGTFEILRVHWRIDRDREKSLNIGRKMNVDENSSDNSQENSDWMRFYFLVDRQQYLRVPIWTIPFRLLSEKLQKLNFFMIASWVKKEMHRVLMQDKKWVNIFKFSFYCVTLSWLYTSDFFSLIICKQRRNCSKIKNIIVLSKANDYFLSILSNDFVHHSFNFVYKRWIGYTAQSFIHFNKRNH